MAASLYWESTANTLPERAASGAHRLQEGVDRVLPFAVVVVGRIPVDRVHAAGGEHRGTTGIGEPFGVRRVFRVQGHAGFRGLPREQQRAARLQPRPWAHRLPSPGRLRARPPERAPTRPGRRRRAPACARGRASGASGDGASPDLHRQRLGLALALLAESGMRAQRVSPFGRLHARSALPRLSARTAPPAPAPRPRTAWRGRGGRRGGAARARG